MFRSPNWSSLFSHVLKIGQYSSSSFSSSSSTSTDQLLPPKSTLCHQTVSSSEVGNHYSVCGTLVYTPPHQYVMKACPFSTAWEYHVTILVTALYASYEKEDVQEISFNFLLSLLAILSTRLIRSMGSRN
ncbi:hypothetical protein LguiA_032562 [Lonicera macranthoides]